jgi:hypothetical protein
VNTTRIAILDPRHSNVHIIEVDPSFLKIDHQVEDFCEKQKIPTHSIQWMAFEGSVMIHTSPL